MAAELVRVRHWCGSLAPAKQAFASVAVLVALFVGAGVVSEGTSAGAPSRPRPRPPAPIAGQGYHQVFRDDFRTLNRRVWDSHIWYDDPPRRAWSHFQTVEHGILRLRTSRRFRDPNGDWPINTVTTFSSGRTWTQGYFEARMRWTRGDGAWPGFWLMSYRHARNPAYPHINPYCARNRLPKPLCFSAEIDGFEGQGSEPHAFYGTVHRNSSEGYGITDQQNPNNERTVRADLTNAFHTYGVLWTARRISWYLDGKKLLSAPVYDSTNQPMFLLLQMWTGGWTKDPDAQTPETLETDVDYVQVWQKPRG
jgi:beta-glucanase (GH16 family)